MNWGLINFLGGGACLLLAWHATFWAMIAAHGGITAFKASKADTSAILLVSSFASRALALASAAWAGVLLMRAFS